jgi:hypothetical protein
MTFMRRSEQIQARNLTLKPAGPQVKQMFWACFSGDQRRSGLIPLFGDSRGGGTRNGVNWFTIYDLYQPVLPTLIQPVRGQDGIFMHDNASVHKAYIVRELLQDLNITVMEWPPYLPDLNPIENIWALLKANLHEICPELRGVMPKNEATRQLLEDTAYEAWQQLDMAIFESLAEAMPRRVKVVIEADGWYTKY